MCLRAGYGVVAGVYVCDFHLNTGHIFACKLKGER